MIKTSPHKIQCQSNFLSEMLYYSKEYRHDHVNSHDTPVSPPQLNYTFEQHLRFFALLTSGCQTE